MSTGIMFLDYGFMARAGAGVVALSLSAAPLGVFLVQRRMSLAGDAMAHAILPGAALGYLASGLSLLSMTLGGVLAGLLVAVLAGLTARTTVLKEDTSLAAFYLLSLALGVLIISVKGDNVDLLAVLFGSVLALDNATLILIGAVSSVTLFALAVILRPLALDSYDRGFLRTVSRWSTPVHLLFLTLLVFNLVAGFHAVGTLLAVALVVLPAACARLWRRDLDGMLMVAVLAALFGGVAGLIIAYVWPVPAGPAIVLGLGVFYLVSIVAGPQGALAQRWGRMHVEG